MTGSYSQTQDYEAPSDLAGRVNGSASDNIVAAISLVLFAIWIYVFRFHHAFEEYDLYSVVLGLIDGVDSGLGMASPLHYGKSFGFGYIAAMYWFVNQRVLRDPDLLIPLVNQIGFWSAIVGAAFFWLSTRVRYGARVATIALVIFAFSPMMLDLGTSGHQILPAFALFAAGSMFLFLRTKGPAAVLCEVAGSLLLLAALTVRAEIFLALPYVVIARSNFDSVRRFVASAATRCIGPGMAFAAFFLLKHFLVDRQAGAPLPSGKFFDMFYSAANLPKGVVILIFGCGGATTLLWLVAMFRGRRTGALAGERVGQLRAMAGPFALVLPALVFWIANPVPARHFILCLAGIGILIGQGLAGWRPKAAPTYGLALLAVVANQAIAATAGPVILAHTPSPYFPVPGVPRIAPRVPLSSNWAYRRELQAERDRIDSFANTVFSACDSKLLLLTAWQRPIFLRLYAGGRNVDAALTYLNGFPVVTGKIDGREYVVVSTPEGWPRDAVADVLRDPEYDSFRLMVEPDTISANEKTPIPPDRAARMGCVALPPGNGAAQ